MKQESKRKGTGRRRDRNIPLQPEAVILMRRKRLMNRRDVTSFFGRLLGLAVFLGILFGFIFGITPMANDDMKPRLSAGDLLLYYRLADSWHINDIAVFEKDNTEYTGRIVAQGGDTVEITDSATLVINGSTVVENDIYFTTPLYEGTVTYPMTLEEDQFFILCDFRHGAKDSRYFGPVSLSEIKGKVITVIRRSGL